ncbi:Gfo/Idh/MocA family oxidoreductase [Paenibacillus validus]|uniref:Gfo/Idh/MocA family protein n=1 Tax=Paenibacillus TaxID=44249 RepID=UPI000FDC3FFE|nr:MULTISPECIES: Gfo/Idh/MocA family oxidoreductase [Paenibacillus]MED4600530.1 Gfo/Idh/MocA family oxidoreductase [Paenibacillus validus]MED4604789.1 Gfo/Idh/MocA family oxidoreductase [Paenibacillus validus]
MLKVGVIGCGAIAQRRHLPEYSKRSDVEIVAVCDFNLERAKEVAQTFGAKFAFQTHQELLACEEIEAVSVCAPNFLHASITLDAIHAGKHVLCEKPMATSLEEAKSMVDAASEKGVKLMIGHSQRFMPVHLKAKEILDEGKLGKVLSFQTTFGHSGPENWSVDGSKSWFFNQDEAFAGVLGDLGVHKADLIRWLLNDEVSEVSAMYGTLHKNTNVDDHAVITIKTHKGAIGTLTASWTYYPNENNSTIIYCEKGTLKIGTDDKFGLIVEHLNKHRELYEMDKMQTNEAGGQTDSGIIDHFVEGILSGQGHSVTGIDGYKALEIVLAGIHAANEKKNISLIATI